MQVIACQYDILWEDREGNFRKIRKLLEAKEILPGALIVLPEMFSSGFSMDVERIAEASPSSSEKFLQELATRYQSWVIAGLVFRSENGRGRNELAIVNPVGEITGRYQKNRCFRYTGETEHYDSGRELLVSAVGDFSVCPFICYDLRFPELFRRGTKRGANLFVVIASWPATRVEHWMTLLRARAIENLAVVIGVNRCGDDPAYHYPGRSLVIDELGEVIADAGEEEGVLVTDISATKLQAWRDEFPALQDLEAD
tara:strand:+ start:15579 stop:16346 length:768 start_codon:yes stop_codon:yes gene_type:complete